MRQAGRRRKREHLNSAKTQIQTPNMLMSSVSQEFQQQYPRFRCSVGRKGRRVQTRPEGTSGRGSTERHHKPPHASELRKMRIQATNTLTTSTLLEIQQQYPRFRCSVEMKHARMQTRPGGTSGRGSTERHHKPPHASEPEPKPQISSQLTEQLSVAEIRQESLRVQMHRKTTASELRKNADSST